MGFFRATGGFIYRTFLDVPSWLGWRNIKRDTKTLYEMGRTVFTVSKAEHKETFEQATIRLKLSEQDIKKAAHYYFTLAILFIGLGILCIGYTFYLFFGGAFLAGIIALLIAFFVFLKAFSAHFQYFQIKNRKLGCSFREWLNGSIEVSKE
ncbi:MAG: type IVB secretion system protein IcmV [Gammaproteobacteria bacterium]|nr:type IVB secretion system protein IcmV [Gammaproteobacteria bacterium]